MTYVRPVDWRDLDQPKVGDMVTVEGVFEKMANPERRWFQFWKPKHVVSESLQQYKITSVKTMGIDGRMMG